MQRNKHHRKTAEGIEWIRRIKEFGCIVCHRSGIHSPADAHHPKDKSTGRPVQDTEAIPLCPNHHSPNGVNGVAFHATGRKTWEAIYGTEQELLEETRRLIEEGRCRI